MKAGELKEALASVPDYVEVYVHMNLTDYDIDEEGGGFVAEVRLDDVDRYDGSSILRLKT